CHTATHDFLRRHKHSIRPELRWHQIGDIDISFSTNPCVIQLLESLIFNDAGVPCGIGGKKVVQIPESCQTLRRLHKLQNISRFLLVLSRAWNPPTLRIADRDTRQLAIAKYRHDHHSHTVAACRNMAGCDGTYDLSDSQFTCRHFIDRREKVER